MEAFPRGGNDDAALGNENTSQVTIITKTTTDFVKLMF
jgi:hypothetical protein